MLEGPVRPGTQAASASCQLPPERAWKSVLPWPDLKTNVTWMTPQWQRGQTLSRRPG